MDPEKNLIDLINSFTEILEHELVPALGCTDPAGVAYASAYARQYLRGDLVKVHGEISVNVIKNAAAVRIPRSGGKYGIAMALALGALAGNPDSSLEVFSELLPTDVELAETMVSNGGVTYSIADVPEKLFISVTVTTMEGTASIVIRNQYSNVVDLVVNGIKVLHKADAPGESDTDLSYEKLSLANIISYAENAPMERLSMIEEAIRINMAIAKEGLSKEYGISAGKSIKKYIENGSMGSGLVGTAMMWVAAATDARMAGCDMPVISNTGSGNQGLASTVPVVSVALTLQSTYQTMVRAVAISSLVTIYLKSRLGALSAVCGAVIAGAGTGCGTVYLLGGRREQMLITLNSTLGDIAGMLCDGAKAGCAMKSATCINTGIVSALMAMDQKGIEGSDGIVDYVEEKTIDNFVRIAKDGMGNLDQVILDIILKKGGAVE